jgi:polysaccharide chain length determinant protein (PEP-CTERM system associated)
MRQDATAASVVAKMRSDIDLELISVDTIDRRTGRPSAATIAFKLSYQGRDPATVQRVTNTLVSLFLNENIQVRQRQTTETSVFLNEEAQRVKNQLDELEEKLSAYKQRYMNALPEMLQVNLRSLENYESGAVRIDEQIRMLKEREGYLQAQLASIPETENTEKHRLRELKLVLVELQTRFTDDYPDVKKVKREIAELEKRIANHRAAPGAQEAMPDNAAYIALASQLSATRAEIKSLNQQKADLNAKAEEYRRRIEQTPKIEQAYNNLLLDRTNTRAKYDDLLRKAMEANVALGLEKEQKGERFTLIEPPALPENPFKPNRRAIFLIGMVLGLGAGIGLAAVAEFSDHAIHTPKDLYSLSGVPLLVTVSDIVTPTERQARRAKRLFWGVVACIGMGVGMLVVHLFVMDLHLFWAKVSVG